MGALVPGPSSPPDVPIALSSLPGDSLTETILTESLQSIEVTIVRVPGSDVIRVANRFVRTAKMDPSATVVAHFVSSPSPSTPLEHSIEIPPLPVGFYLIELIGHDRTAITQLNVGTLGTIADRVPEHAVMLALDLRTFRHRSDVAMLEYAQAGRIQRFRPDTDGLLIFCA
jgi:hypothetical protein